MTALFKTSPITLTPWERLCLSPARACVLRVGERDEITNAVFASFADMPDTRTAQLDPGQLDPDDTAILGWLHDQQRALGWSPSDLLPDGFSLLVNGEARAYEAGRQVAEGSDALVVGAAIFDVVRWLSGRPGYKALENVDLLRRAARVIDSFKDKLRKHAPDLLIEPRTDSPRTDTRGAFEILGLPETATQREVRGRRRELMGQFHPARAINDGERWAFAFHAALIERAAAAIDKANGWA